MNTILFLWIIIALFRIVVKYYFNKNKLKLDAFEIIALILLGIIGLTQLSLKLLI